MNFADIGIDTASLAGSLESRLAAARAAGFSQVMISASDIAGHAGGADAGIRAVRDSGLRVTGLEALRDFEGLDGQLHAYKLDIAKSMLEICSAIGSRLLLVEASTSAHADAGIDAIVRDLKKLAVLAVPLGIRIAFKGLSWSRTVKDFAAAGDIVLRANLPNLGIAIDAFDVIAAGVPPEGVEGVDPEQIFLVQLSDYMWQETRTTEEQAATARHFRVFPGEGAHSEALAKSRHAPRRHRLLRRLQLRRLQRRLPADPAGGRCRPRAARGRLAGRDRTATCAARAEHGAPATTPAGVTEINPLRATGTGQPFRMRTDSLKDHP